MKDKTSIIQMCLFMLGLKSLFTKYFPCYNDLLYFTCSFTDRTKFAVPVKFLYRKIFCITIAAKYLHRICADLLPILHLHNILPWLLLWSSASLYSSDRMPG